ncbi:ATP-binding protein [Rhabdothermincola sediminis]|uniref:ATP-binding protein n=1 Tax=Rhabdothermincola sediminis TaxID=2751370 RepID=UPI001AA05085|nr:ATP-binding protein [Rhabdothermincola sediminis]
MSTSFRGVGAGPAPLVEAQASFAPESVSVGQARAFVVSALGLAGGTASTVALLTSELASNAVLHARTRFTITVERFADHVRVGVGDTHRGLPVFRGRQASDLDSGRGLVVVHGLARRWGMQVDGDGKEVWFEVALPAE